MKQTNETLGEIPIIHCFNRNYVLPAGVCFYSLLQHANPSRRYSIHVVGTGLSKADCACLERVVGLFPNASLHIMEAPPLALPKVEGNFSKDLYHKLKLADWFPQYDRVVVADVDVVYADDVALAFDCLRSDEDIYFAGPEDVSYAVWHGKGILRDSGLPKSLRRYTKNFSAAERARMILGSGFMTLNLAKMRRENVAERCLKFVQDNAHRLILPEMDVLNLVCSPALKAYPPRMMAIAGYWREYARLTQKERASNPAWDAMFAHPVQIHYASGIKPWKYPDSPMADLWFDALLESGLFSTWRKWIDDFIHHDENLVRRRKIFSFCVPLGLHRRIALSLEKETDLPSKP